MSRLFLAGVAVSLVFHVIALPVEAAVFEVDRFDDPFPSQNCASGVDVDCSLREAVITANNTAGPDLIIIPAGTFNLTRSGTPEDAAVSGDLDLTEAVRIEGAGMTTTIIDGGGPGVLGDRIIDILGVEVEIEGLTIRGGSGVISAGGLNNRSGSTLTLTETMITANQADTVAGWAGGMQTAGICTLIFSVVHDNEASRAGGIDASGTTIIQDSWISDNRALADSEWSGGGILTFAAGSSTTLIRTTVSGNTSASYGGGLHAYGPTTIVDSTFESNYAAKFGGAISVAPSRTVTVEKSAFSGTPRMLMEAPSASKAGEPSTSPTRPSIQTMQGKKGAPLRSKAWPRSSTSRSAETRRLRRPRSSTRRRRTSHTTTRYSRAAAAPRCR